MVKWIKICTDIFDDEKILLIESMPSGDTIIVIWFKLLCLAGKSNNSGVFTLYNFAYTDEMLATIMRRDIKTIRMALEVFEKLGMIQIIQDVITIPNWEKYQKTDQLEERKEYMKKYMQERRNKQKEIAVNTCKVNSKVNSKANGKVNVNYGDIYKEDIYKEEYIKDIVPLDTQKDSKIENSTEKKVFDFWNNKKIVVHKTYTEQLEKLINNKIKFYGLDKIYMAIDNYSKIYNDKNYFFSYKWTLKEFLSQSNALPEFLEDGSKWLNYKNRSKTDKKEKDSPDWVDEYQASDNGFETL